MLEVPEEERESGINFRNATVSYSNKAKCLQVKATGMTSMFVQMCVSVNVYCISVPDLDERTPLTAALASMRMKTYILKEDAHVYSHTCTYTKGSETEHSPMVINMLLNLNKLHQCGVQTMQYHTLTLDLIKDGVKICHWTKHERVLLLTPSSA